MQHKWNNCWWGFLVVIIPHRFIHPACGDLHPFRTLRVLSCPIVHTAVWPLMTFFTNLLCVNRQLVYMCMCVHAAAGDLWPTSDPNRCWGSEPLLTVMVVVLRLKKEVSKRAQREPPGEGRREWDSENSEVVQTNESLQKGTEGGGRERTTEVTAN